MEVGMVKKGYEERVNEPITLGLGVFLVDTFGVLSGVLSGVERGVDS
jgi:hypothetical protein